MKLSPLFLASLLLTGGAALAQEHRAVPIPGPSPPPPGPVYVPPAPAPWLNRKQAIELARSAAREQGFEVKKVKDADLDDGLWVVRLDAHPKGKIEVVVDARTGQVVELREKGQHGKGHGKGHGKHDED